jgi:beta-lactamase class A
VVHNLDTGDKVSINGHKNFETASIYKLFVMTAIYYDISQDNLSLDTPITLTGAAADAEEDGGALIVDIGESLPVRNLLEAMITSSNNTAGLMLLFQVKIPRLKQIISNLGFKESDLSDSYNYQATPEDLDQLLSRLATQKLLGPQYDQQMLDMMSQQKIRDRIPALLPPGTRVANKTGDIDGINNDTGLVFLPNGQRLAITVMVHNSNNFTASRQFISDISLAAYNFYAVTK